MKRTDFRKRKAVSGSEVAVAASPQTFGRGMFADRVYPGAEAGLYSAMRSSIPILDGAICKIVRLTGGYTVECDNREADRLLKEFIENVNVGGTSRGIENFTDIYLDQLLTCGAAIGEMVLNDDLRSFSLFNSRLDGVTVERDEANPGDIVISVGASGKNEPVENQSSVLYSVLDPTAGSLSGNSLLKSLPFVSSVLMQIFDTVGSNWERMGSLRYAVTYRPQNDALDKAYAKERAMQIAKGWSEAMKSSDEIKDFIAVGDVDIKVIGADSQILDSEVPVRQLTEQIIAKTGLPPFMLGLNWSTSERMAKQQTDILTSELYHYRRILTPVIRKICGMYLRMNGYEPSCRVVWDDISLLDIVEEAKARYYDAHAEKLRAEAANTADENGEVK